MKNSFDLAFQPINDIRSSTTFGYELLLRSDVPSSTLFSSNSVTQIHMLDRKIRQLANDIVPPSDKVIFINCHPLTLLYDELLFNDISLLRNKFPLVVEITEQHIPDLDLFSRRINELQSIGVSIAFDDFGTEYSGFDLFQYARPEFVKIDRSFLQNIDNYARMVEIRNLLKNLSYYGCRVVVEGIETPEQFDFISSSLAQYAQGFFIGYPLLSGEFFNSFD